MKGTKGKQVVVPVSTGSRMFPHIPRHTDRFRKLYAGDRSAVELLAPERSERLLAEWRRWLLGNSRLIVLVALIVIGTALMVRGARDLIA